MLDFISINMAQALPISSIFGIGLILIQIGINMLKIQYDTRSLFAFIFLAYWLLFSLGIFKGIGPTNDLDWIGIAALLSPFAGLAFCVISFVVSRFLKGD